MHWLNPAIREAVSEWYRAFQLTHRERPGVEAGEAGDPGPALGGEHNYGPRIVAMLEEFASDRSRRQHRGLRALAARRTPD